MSRYRRFIESLPDKIVDSVDNKLTDRTANKKQLKEAAQFAKKVKVGTKLYATDGSRAFYYLRTKSTQFSSYWMCFGREPSTNLKVGAETIWLRHQGRLTDRRPSDWISAATLSAANYGGLDGGPAVWAPEANEDLDYDPILAEKLWHEDRLPRYGSAVQFK